MGPHPGKLAYVLPLPGTSLGHSAPLHAREKRAMSCSMRGSSRPCVEEVALSKLACSIGVPARATSMLQNESVQGGMHWRGCLPSDWPCPLGAPPLYTLVQLPRPADTAQWREKVVPR